MRALAALRGGARRLLALKRVIVIAYLANLVLALGLGGVLYSTLSADFGASLSGARMAESFDSLWYSGFSARISDGSNGVADSFSPSVTGFGAVLDAVDSYLGGLPDLLAGGIASGVLPVVGLYLLLWSFLGAGLVGQLVSRESSDSGSGGLLRHGARFFPRWVAFSLAGVAAFWLIFGPLRSRLDGVVETLTRDSIDERIHFFATLAEYTLLWLLLWGVGLVLDYAKIAALRSGKVSWLHSQWRGFGRGLGIVVRHPLSAAGLSALTGVLWLLLALIYGAFVPGADHSSSISILLTFLGGQCFIVGQIAIRCMVYASETTMSEMLDPSGGRMPVARRDASTLRTSAQQA